MKTSLRGTISLILGSFIQMLVQAEPSLTTGFLKQEVYTNISGTMVEDLTSNEKFIGAKPDAVNWLNAFESGVNVADNYGQRLSGLLVPPVTGNYIFFIASDDNSELWLSADAKPENKQLVASVSGWTGSREWNKFPDTQNNAATPIRLQAGKPYYIEALMKEGGGGDNLAVGWTLPDQYVDPGNPPDGLTNVTVISAQFLGGYVEVANSKVSIISQPTNLTSFTGQRAVFSVAAQGTSDLGSLVLYQWKRNGADIPGATRAFYTTPELTLADNAARYTCVVSVPGVAVTSLEATLTVMDAQSPRLHIESAIPQKTNVVIWWETPDPGFYLQGTPGLSPVSWQSASEAIAYQSTRSAVTAPVAANRFFRLSHTNILFESLWADSVTPATAAGAPSATEFGTVFSATAPGLVRAIRLYIMPGESGIHLARLWRNRDNQLVGGPYEISFGGIEGWVVYFLPKPVSIEPNAVYTVSVSTGQDAGRACAYSENVVASPGGNGRSLRYPAGAGVFTTQSGTRPTQSQNNSLYFRDVLFLPSEIATENLITWELDRPVSYERGGESVPYELGTVFRSSSPGMVMALRLFAISAEGGLHTAMLWKNSDDVAVGGPYEFTCGANGGVGASTWFVYSLPTPVAIEANRDYTVTVTTGTDSSLAYPFLNQAFQNPGGNGLHLSYPAGAGVSGPVGSRPTEVTLGTNRNSSFLRDVVFQATGSTESETVLGGGAVYAGRQSPYKELGTIFQTSTPGLIKGIRVYSLAGESGVHIARLWKNSDNSLIGGPYSLTYGESNRWWTFELTNAVSIQSNTLYTVSVTVGEDSQRVYPIVPDGFAAAGSNAKHLSYPALAGVFGTTPGQRPTWPTNVSFLRDIVFQPAATAPRATLGNSTDGNFADYITDANTAWINAMRFKATANMTATVIKAKIDSVPGRYQCAIYSDQRGMADRLLMSTQEKARPAAAWNEFPLKAPVKLTAGVYYWLAIWSDDTNARVYYTSQSGGTLKWAPYAYGEWPDPITLEANGSTYLYCIYAEGAFDE